MTRAIVIAGFAILVLLGFLAGMAAVEKICRDYDLRCEQVTP